MRVFKTKLIRLQLTAEELEALTADFISYKRDGVLPDIFGRDALYDDSFTWPLIKFERVAHIHLANENNPFPPQLRQFSRTNDEAHLLYCQGAFDEQAWLLIAILKPEPHKQARDNNQMHKIGKMAEAFRMRF